MTVADATAVDVTEALRRSGVSDVDDSGLARALYSSDASLYRVPPRVVVRPRHLDEVLATVAACAETGVPLTARGAGTSIAGNAVGPGVVMDFRRHLGAVEHIDTDSRTAVVQPGTVHADLQRASAPHGLRFGPDPSTHTRCTVGGMIGNNACGSRALGYGRMADNVAGLDVVTIGGERLSLVRGESTTSATLDTLRDVVRGGLSTIRTEFGSFGRQVSGYSLEHLLPENDFDVATFLTGTEGTLAIQLGATVDLVRDAPHRVLVVLGYPSMAHAADAVPELLPYEPIACEGLDSRIVDVVAAQRGAYDVPNLPAGQGWLFVELAGEDASQLASLADKVARTGDAQGSRIVDSVAEQAALWRIREEGAGLAARSLERPALSGWEDAAVPPERLGGYLREFEALLVEHDLKGIPYGHFGDGCVHIRIDFQTDEAESRSAFRRFLEDAADLVSGHGGSLSGEHGDGRARSELLPRMYSAPAIDLFEQVKRVFDPDDLLNPGVLVRPSAVDADVRRSGRGDVQERLALRLVHDDGDFGAAVHRCTGVGKCIADSTGSGGVMCPSYLATGDEKDSTRGRARVLQEMVDGSLVDKGWRSPEVHEALDLCLSCKGCLSDCPTGIDMATYKAEVLHQSYRRRLRPRSHYMLGWLPRWARLTAPIAWLANLVLGTPGLRTVARWLAGVDQRRSLPTFATTTLRRWSRRRPGRSDGTRPSGGAEALPGAQSGAPGRHGDVVIWADSFTDYFSTGAGKAAFAVLEDAGYNVSVLDRSACCGLTWISTGQLDAARRIVTRTLETLDDVVSAGVPVVGLEPSCLAVLRSDALDLVDDPRAGRVAAGVHTLAELLSRTEDWTPPDLSGYDVIAQPHCHHAAVLGWRADAALLERSGAAVRRMGGCCGLAGNFGVELGHHDVSVAVAEHQLLPAVREAAVGTVVLADGFSCRTQLDDLADVHALHLAELLDRER